MVGSIDAAVKINSVKGHVCNRRTTIVCKYYGDNNGQFDLTAICGKLQGLNVEYEVHYIDNGDYMIYVCGNDKSTITTSPEDVTASDDPRTPGSGDWEEPQKGKYKYNPNEEDKGFWNPTEGDENTTYYWNPTGTPGYPSGNKESWNEMLYKDKGVIDDINKYRASKNPPIPLLPTEPPFQVPFNGTPPNLYPDLGEYAYGQPVTLNMYSSSRAFNYYMAEEAYAAQSEYTPTQVRNYMKEHKLTWHESEDGRTMMKVPTLIHQNVPHNGGVNAVKRESIACADNKAYDSYFIPEKKQSPVGAGNDLNEQGMNINNNF